MPWCWQQCLEYWSQACAIERKIQGAVNREFRSWRPNKWCVLPIAVYTKSQWPWLWAVTMPPNLCLSYGWAHWQKILRLDEFPLSFGMYIWSLNAIQTKRWDKEIPIGIQWLIFVYQVCLLSLMKAALIAPQYCTDLGLPFPRCEGGGNWLWLPDLVSTKWGI